MPTGQWQPTLARSPASTRCACLPGRRMPWPRCRCVACKPRRQRASPMHTIRSLSGRKSRSQQQAMHAFAWSRWHRAKPGRRSLHPLQANLQDRLLAAASMVPDTAGWIMLPHVHTDRPARRHAGASSAPTTRSTARRTVPLVINDCATTISSWNQRSPSRHAGIWRRISS